MQKVLLVGSAPYSPHWWAKHGDSFDQAHCLNNAVRVVGQKHATWYVSEDFLWSQNYDMRRVTGVDTDHFRGFRMCASYLHRPHWYTCPYNGTMVVNAAYDILNKATLHGIATELNLVGCDMDYSKPETHFYNGGTPDPARIPEDVMRGHLMKLRADFEPMHRIVTLGPKPSILPFPHGDPELVWST